jgi:hypothetical protein
MTTVYYVVNPATQHGRSVIGFARAFLSFAHEVFRRDRLRDLKYVVFTDEDGARNADKYTREPDVLRMIDDLRHLSGVCWSTPTGLYDTLERVIVLCLRLYKPEDRVMSVRATAHEFIHHMTVPNEGSIMDGFIRMLTSDVAEFREVVETVMGCYNKGVELRLASEETLKRLAELEPEFRELVDKCCDNFSIFRLETRKFAIQIVAEYIALNYFVLLHRFPVLRFRSILAMPYVFKYYVEHLATLFMEAVSTLAVNSAHAYHRLAHPEKPAEETVAFTMSVEGKVGGLRKKLQYGDHPKLRGFIHDVFLSTLRSPTVFPADVAPKYPEIYYEVMHLAREVAPVPIK